MIISSAFYIRVFMKFGHCEAWNTVWKHGPRYTPTTCLETFPFPKPNEQQKNQDRRGGERIERAARELAQSARMDDNPHVRISRLNRWSMVTLYRWRDGLRVIPIWTDGARPSIGTVRYPRIEPRDEECAKKLAKRTLTNLYNERPAWQNRPPRQRNAAHDRAADEMI